MVRWRTYYFREKLNEEIKQKTIFPTRVTTRPTRQSDNKNEVSHLSYNKFIGGLVDGAIVIPHQIRDKWNGLLMPNYFKDIFNNTLFMQALQTAAGVKFRDKYNDLFDVIICRLKAPENTVLFRLGKRDTDVTNY